MPGRADIIHVRKGSIIIIHQPGAPEVFAGQLTQDWHLVERRTTADQINILVTIGIIAPVPCRMERDGSVTLTTPPLPLSGIRKYSVDISKPLKATIHG